MPPSRIQTHLVALLVIADTLLATLYFFGLSDFTSTVALSVPVNIPILVALISSLNGAEADGEDDPLLISGIPPSKFRVNVEGKRVMGDLVKHARLNVPVEMMAIGPRSSARMNLDYHYVQVDFATHAGLYRVPKRR